MPQLQFNPVEEAKTALKTASLPEHPVIGVIGLGYVGLPLACLFAKKYQVTGLDIDESRVAALNEGADHKEQCDKDSLKSAIGKGLKFTSSIDDLAGCNVFVVSVPTPVGDDFLPDFAPLLGASELVAKVMKPGDVIIYESTVNPGATEDVCVPALERASGMKFNRDFYVGYSPERVNPGNSIHTVEKICKITSGSTPETARFVDRLYSSVLDAGTCPVSSIKVAEAAKILENTQRDVNIALMNEVAILFDAIGIDTREVIDAAATKWNFGRYTPGLVGGHCISVDPYYLINKARECGIDPMVMVSARTRNEGMASHIVSRLRRTMKAKGIQVKDSRVLLVGFTFKADCNDTRNTKVYDIYNEISDFTANIDVFDPNVEPDKVMKSHAIKVISDWKEISEKKYDAVIFCVAHSSLANYDFKPLMAEPCASFDIMGSQKRHDVDDRL